MGVAIASTIIGLCAVAGVVLLESGYFKEVGS
jgi:hypothetical protein